MRAVIVLLFAASLFDSENVVCQYTCACAKQVMACPPTATQMVPVAVAATAYPQFNLNNMMAPNMLPNYYQPQMMAAPWCMPAPVAAPMPATQASPPPAPTQNPKMDQPRRVNDPPPPSAQSPMVIQSVVVGKKENTKHFSEEEEEEVVEDLKKDKKSSCKKKNSEELEDENEYEYQNKKTNSKRRRRRRPRRPRRRFFDMFDPTFMDPYAAFDRFD